MSILEDKCAAHVDRVIFYFFEPRVAYNNRDCQML